jgi:protein-tyrosine phosphatase
VIPPKSMMSLGPGHRGVWCSVRPERRLARHDGPMPTRERLLPLVGAYNFRDLGGYRTVDGRVTRWGVLYRSDTLHELTPADLEVLRGLGLASVIDLRTASEVEQTGRGLLQGEPIRYLHLSVMQEGINQSDNARSLADTELAVLYLRWLESGRNALVEALSTVADATAYPLVFHCAAGKDRTGVLAALVLDIVGVAREVIVEDYVLTATRLDLIRARQRSDPQTAKSMAEAPHLFAVKAATMEAFLDGLHERHGGAREWALRAGVPAAVVGALRDQLVEGAE